MDRRDHCTPREPWNPHLLVQARAADGPVRQGGFERRLPSDVSCVLPAPLLLDDAWDDVTRFLDSALALEAYIGAVGAPALYTAAQKAVVDGGRDVVQLLRHHGLLPSPGRGEVERAIRCARQLRSHAYQSEEHVAKRDACEELVRVMELLSGTGVSNT